MQEMAGPPTQPCKKEKQSAGNFKFQKTEAQEAIEDTCLIW